MATTPVDSGGIQSTPSPMVAVPGAKEAPVILGTGIGTTAHFCNQAALPAMTKYFGGLMYHGDASELTPLKGRKPNGDFMTKGSEEYSPLHCKLLAMALLEESDIKGLLWLAGGGRPHQLPRRHVSAGFRGGGLQLGRRRRGWRGWDTPGALRDRLADGTVGCVACAQ